MSYLIEHKVTQVMRELKRILETENLKKSISNQNLSLEKLHYITSHQSRLINN